uniref:Inner centromere protein isoform X2 n=1 Tax=Petromyzon marinus TaxID=7757 RepID=A0AAJ7UDN7_PETMA|nr:inner centromere protein isoform X2 [Petromyzon marinus]
MDVTTSFAELLASLNEMVEQRLQEMVREVEEKHFVWLDEILGEAKGRFCCGEPELLPKTPSAKNRQKKRKSLLVKDPRKCSWGSGRRSSARRSLKTHPYPMLASLAESETAAPLVKAAPPATPPGEPVLAIVTTTCSGKVELAVAPAEEKFVLQCNDGSGSSDLETQAGPGKVNEPESSEVAVVEPGFDNICRTLMKEFTNLTDSPTPQPTGNADKVPERLQVKKNEVKQERPHCTLTRLQKKKEKSTEKEPQKLAKVLRNASMRSMRRNPGKDVVATPTKTLLTSTRSSPTVMSTAPSATCSSTPMCSSARETGNDADAMQVIRRPSLKRPLLIGFNITPMKSPPRKRLQTIPAKVLKRAVTFAETGPRSFVSQICKVFTPGRPLLVGHPTTPKAIVKPDALRKADSKESERQALADQLKKKQEMDEERKRKAEETKKQKLEEMRKKREERQQKAREKMEQQELNKKRKAEEKTEKEEEERLRKANEAKKLLKTPVPLLRAVKITLNPASKVLLNQSIKPQMVDSPQTYEMTPQSATVPKPPQIIGENYGIDLESGDSTDDEHSPKKDIPLWATDKNLAHTLQEQYATPPNLDDLFDVIEVPDLEVIFNKRKKCYVSRSSSANWNSPPLKNTRLGILGH